MNKKPPIPELIPEYLMPEGYCEQLSNAVIARMNQSKQNAVGRPISGWLFSAAAGIALLISAFVLWYMKPEPPIDQPLSASESVEEYLLTEEFVSESDLLVALTGEEGHTDLLNEYELFITQ